MRTNRLSSIVVRDPESLDPGREVHARTAHLIPPRQPSPFRVGPLPTSAVTPAGRRIATTNPPPRLRAGSICLAIFLGTAFATFALVCIEAYRNAHATPFPASAQGAAKSAAGLLPADLSHDDFGLRVQPSDGRLLISWDRGAQPVRSAVSGLLTIDDGSRHRKIDLDMNQVHTGAVLYRPVTGDISLELSLSDAEGVPATQTYRILDSALGGGSRGMGSGAATLSALDRMPRSSAGDDAATATAPSGNAGSPAGMPAMSTASSSDASGMASAAGSLPKSGGTPAPPAGTDATASKIPALEDHSSTATTANPTSASHAGSPDDRAGEGTVVLASAAIDRAQRAKSLDEQSFHGAAAAVSPGVSGGPAARSAQGPGAKPPSIVALPTHPLSSPPVPAASKANGPLSSGAPDPVVIREIEPKPQRTVSPDAAALRVLRITHPCELHLYVSIDEKGNVTAVHPLSGGSFVGPEVVAASVAAARQWKFLPAKNGSLPVKSHYGIVFRFQPTPR